METTLSSNGAIPFKNALFNFYIEREFVDTTLILADGNLQTHSLVIASESKTLYELLKSQNELQKTIELPQFSKEVMRKVLEYIYRGIVIYPSYMDESIKLAIQFLQIKNIQIPANEKPNDSIQFSESSLSVIEVKNETVIVEISDDDIDVESHDKTDSIFSESPVIQPSRNEQRYLKEKYRINCHLNNTSSVPTVFEKQSCSMEGSKFNSSLSKRILPVQTITESISKKQSCLLKENGFYNTLSIPLVRAIKEPDSERQSQLKRHVKNDRISNNISSVCAVLENTSAIQRYSSEENDVNNSLLNSVHSIPKVEEPAVKKQRCLEDETNNTSTEPPRSECVSKKLLFENNETSSAILVDTDPNLTKPRSSSENSEDSKMRLKNRPKYKIYNFLSDSTSSSDDNLHLSEDNLGSKKQNTNSDVSSNSKQKSSTSLVINPFSKSTPKKTTHTSPSVSGTSPKCAKKPKVWKKSSKRLNNLFPSTSKVDIEETKSQSEHEHETELKDETSTPDKLSNNFCVICNKILLSIVSHIKYSHRPDIRKPSFRCYTCNAQFYFQQMFDIHMDKCKE